MEFQLATWISESDNIIRKSRKALMSAENLTGINLQSQTLPPSVVRADQPITIAFVGQYSAGKSSIISMLTKKDDIPIGEGITTQQTYSFDWNGMTIIDTPGIHSGLRPDHDDITYEALAKADMLVFVTTNELFDAHLAAHFRKLAIEQSKANEMLLVINKICRGGTGKSYKDTLTDDVRPVLDPFTPEDLYISFVDAKSWHDAQKEEDPERREYLLARCGRDNLITNLNRFVEEKHINAKLTTPLYHVTRVLSQALDSLQISNGDQDIDAILEHLRQQRHILETCIQNIETETRHTSSSYADKIRSKGYKLADQVALGCDPDALDDQLKASVRETERLIDDCKTKIDSVIEDQIRRADKDMNSLFKSEFTIKLNDSLNMKTEKLPPVVNKILHESGTFFQKAGMGVVKSATKDGGTILGKKLADFADTDLNKIVVKIGHFFHYKFKPWESVKITQKIAGLGKVLSVAGVVVDISMNVKMDVDQNRAEKNIRDCKRNIRNSFDGAANDLERSSNLAVNEFLQSPDSGLIGAIHTIDQQQAEIRNLNKNQNSSYEEIKLLLDNIHAMICQLQP